MNEKEAIEYLNKLINESEQLKNSYGFSEEHTKWLTNVQEILDEIFGTRSRIFLNFKNINWVFVGTFPATIDEYEFVKRQKDHEAYLRALDMTKGLLRAGIDLIKRKGIETAHKPKESNEIIKIISSIDNRLRKTIHIKPTREKEINDALENLFIALELDYKREKIRIVYSTKTYEPDFVFEKINAVVEGKLCDNEKREKDIISEINDDIMAYKTKYANLIFIIYDLGVIRDQDQFRESIETKDQVIIRIIKH